MNLFKKLFGLKKRGYRFDTDSVICGTFLSDYISADSPKNYGKCEVYRMINLSVSGLALRHKGSIKKGDVLEFRTKYCIMNKNCFSCTHVAKVEEKLALNPVIGRVIWCNDFLAGINIIDISTNDLQYLEKIVADGGF